MGKFSTVRDLLSKLVADAPEVSKTVSAGRKALLKEEGTNSLFGGAANWLAQKIKGEEPVKDWLYHNVQRPLKNVDEKSGKALAETFHAPNLFRHVDVLPTGCKIDGNKALIEHVTHSATAPVGKAARMATPILAIMGADKLMNGEEKTAEKVEDKNDLLKEASAALTQAHRRVEAEKIAFALVEKGKSQPFSSYDSFQEKVAELLEKDLSVVKEALSMDGSLADFGKVAEDKSTVAGGDQATSQFFHALAD